MLVMLGSCVIAADGTPIWGMTATPSGHSPTPMVLDAVLAALVVLVVVVAAVVAVAAVVVAVAVGAKGANSFESDNETLDTV